MTPVCSYRLQLTPDFGFAAAAAQTPYLASLGLTHVYLSPVLQAAPGSTHGYDVTDHSRISTDLGGEDGFRQLAARCREAGLGIVVDLVPNHMAIPVPESLNRQLWTVLRDGPDARYARWFDIDWAAGDGQMLLPVLGKPAEECLSELQVDPRGGREPVLRYYDHQFPLREQTHTLPLPELLAAQHYRLAYWREASENLNWRRFFDISTLIGVRVEDPEVFDATHATVLRLLDEDLIDGLRIDHPDGLADPRGYLRRLDAATGGRWTVVEKILEADERLPGDWPCAGTTGYDALRVADGLFTDPDGADPLLAEYQRFAGPVQAAGPGAGTRSATFAEVAAIGKREVTTGVLAAEVARLARSLVRARPGTDPGDARTVLAEVLAAFGVYRAYAHPGEPVSAVAEQQVRDAVGQAKKRLPDDLHRLADAVGDLALGQYPQAAEHPQGGFPTAREVAGDQAAVADFMTRFGQTTGPVLAKGIEDTASYRWPRLLARNEVGGDPDRFAVPPAEFHAFAARLATDWPRAMTTLSTHDTKRAEDVRARLAVLSELPAEWGRRVADWHARAQALRPAGADPATLADPVIIDPATEYLLWQTVVGAWPLTAERLTGYLRKAMREAKTRTSWIEPDERYENAVRGLAELALEHPELRGPIEDFVGSIAADAAANSLGVKLIQLTMPGVPDVYQGCELTALSLVDPDNRRPVDFGRRQELLRAIDAGDAPGGTADLDLADLDTAKLLVTSRALRLRREHPDWFLTGDYQPLSASGPAADHVVAFARAGQAITVATRLPRALRERGGWDTTFLDLPVGPPRWRDILTGRDMSPRAPLAELFVDLPVALLIPGSGGRAQGG